MNPNIIIVDNFIDAESCYSKEIFDEVPKRISQILNEKVAVKSIISNTEVVRGITSDNTSKWTAVHFTTDPLSLNAKKLTLKFFSHKETGLEYCPDKSTFEKYTTSTDISLWNQYANIQSKYNKLVLFRSNLWHSFGTDLSINFLVYYIK